MNHIRYLIIVLLAVIVLSCGRKSYPPLSLHTKNPHYFLFREKPAILIGSTEPYSAVIDMDFNYITYLNEIALLGLNVTRTFSGMFIASGNPPSMLCSAPERYICPWSRSSEPGYPKGGNIFDLSKWDEAYFSRLKDFISEAGKRNIIVEFDLFTNFYDSVLWKLSPMYFGNNINGIGNTQLHKEATSLIYPEIIDVQEKMVRKIIYELRGFDNLYYEICNEPFYGDTLAPSKWEKYMTSVVVNAEKEFNHKHLISNNIANNYLKLTNPRENVSIYNFHYARPPLTVAMNYHLDKVIGDNETGFDGGNDATYRTEAWNFILAGGSSFIHLDYSFTTKYEDGSFMFDKAVMPGGGSKTLRNQFQILATFMKGLDYINMIPDTSFFRVLKPEKSIIQALVKKNQTYAGYITNSLNNSDLSTAEIEVDLPQGLYKVMWLDTKSGNTVISKLEKHPGGKTRLISPEYVCDITMKITTLR